MSPAVEHPVLSALLQGYAAAPDLAVADLALDSREITAGSLFLACRGHRQHGLDHVAEAITRGAVAVLWEPAPDVAPPALPVPAIAVQALSARAGEIAARFWQQPSVKLQVVGITGTDGKTSTAHLLTQAWTALGTPCLYLGTLGYGRLDALDAGVNTTPDAVRLQRYLAQGVADGARAVAMEVSSHALAQNRIAGTHIAAAVLTNVGRDHLDYHGDLERYAAAKRQLFARDESDALILNRDDSYGATWAAELAGAHPLRLYGLDGERPAPSSLLGRELMLHPQGLSMTLDSGDAQCQLQSRLLGRFNAYNLLAAAAVLLQSGVPLAAAAAALAGAATVPGRAEAFYGAEGSPLVVVDYAHTPQALAQILQALRPHASGRLICVFGCGGERDRGKRPLMGAAAAQFADAVVLTDDNPRSEVAAQIVAEIRAGMPRGARVSVTHDRGRAIRETITGAGAGDVVLIAGKGHETTQVVGDETRPFSDRSVVAQLLGRELAS